MNISKLLITEKHYWKIWLVGLCWIIWFLYAVNVSTYSIQVTSFSVLFPPQRETCPMQARTSCESEKKLRIGILCLYEDPAEHKRSVSNNYWDQTLNERIFRNRYPYANRHGYSIIKTPFYLIDKSRPIAWSKLKIFS